MKDRKTELTQFLKENEDQARKALKMTDFSEYRIFVKKAKMAGLFNMSAPETKVATRLKNIATKHIGWTL